MGERTLRGSRLGSISYETDRNTEPAARQSGEYRCHKGHTFSVPFSEEADIPMVWECRLDGSAAKLVNGVQTETKKGKPPRTHWDMLLERRSVADLEEVLAERLEHLRGRRSQSA